MDGLTQSQAADLLDQFGQNELQHKKPLSVFYLFVKELQSVLIYLLFIASFISFALREYIDGAFILGIIVLNAFFGVYQQRKAQEATEALNKLTTTKTRVIRDNKETEIDSRYLVPGDIIVFEEGSKIPADTELIRAMAIEINESSLTGESMAVIKNPRDLAYMGTIVAKGSGTGKVIATGMKTKIGTIAQSLGDVQETKTPLQKKIESFSQMVGVVGLIISACAFTLALMSGVSAFVAFFLAVSLAVAIVPEGLPAVVTITLAAGFNRMAHKKAILTKLSAIEALGNTTLIATDKTGTLTMNKMKVKEVYSVDPEKSLHLLLLNGVLCSTASLAYSYDLKEYDVLGDPTEGSLLYLAEEKGMNYETIRKEWHILEEIPFNQLTKKMSVTVQKDHEKYIFTKGALEPVLDHITDLSDAKKEEIRVLSQKWGSVGLRILGFAVGNKFLGMVGMYDPPRPEAKKAIEKALQAEIRTVMITGDNEKTAEAIAHQLGMILPEDKIITGDEVQEASDEELKKILPDIRIFARTTPIHKARIIRLYQELGEIVAVTGDGINDAIALKQADIGVAMGKDGTDVARDAADMIISDDNFATIIDAIEEGRNSIKNIKSAILYLVTTNIAEALLLLTALFWGITDLFLPIQLLFINLIGDGIPALAFAFSSNENTMKGHPGKTSRLVDKKEYYYLLSTALISTLLVLINLYAFSKIDFTYARTAAFTILVFIQSFIFLDIWMAGHSLHHIHLFKKPIFWIGLSLPILTQCAILISRVSSFFTIYQLNALQIVSLLLIATIILPLLRIARFLHQSHYLHKG